jgi:all-trans-retinol dehydrogenase (NAD+)
MAGNALKSSLHLLFILLKLPVYWIVHLLGPLWRSSKDVSKETVLITGAGSGIGRLMALSFAMLGSKVVLCDVDEKGIKAVEAEINGARDGQDKVAFAYKMDVSDRKAVYRIADEIRTEVGHVTILINNAGIVNGQALLDSPDARLAKVMEVNATAHFWTLKAFLPNMMENNHGHIVTIASSAGHAGVAGLVDYCASKHAAVGLNESLRLELRKKGKTGIHTTCVCPFYINTGMFDGVVTRFPALFPILEPKYAVSRIMHAIRTNQPVLMVPRTMNLIFLVKLLLPYELQDEACEALGVSDSMDDFKGRDKKSE